MKEEVKILPQEFNFAERRLSKQFIESQKKIIISRIAKYTDRARIAEELRANDVSPYILYKQKEVVPQLKKALRLIDTGEYGICVVCGGNIEMKRLIAVPAAFTCITCMQGGK